MMGGFNHKPVHCGLYMAMLFCIHNAFAQPTGSLPYLKSGPSTTQSSYEARIINRQGVHDMDPNVYVYTPDFASRFQMPSEWASSELKGVDAVAFRVVPSYKSCGWGGNPNACREDEVRCEMDLYFDQQKNPLPWDLRMSASASNLYSQSAYFIAPGEAVKQRLSQTLGRSKEAPNFFTKGSPFTDPATGKELGWQGRYSDADGSRGDIYMGVVSYDREIFAGMSLVTMSGGCGKPADTLSLLFSDQKTVFKRALLPQSWRMRVKQALAQTDERNKAFFQQEGEKALKALREKPIPSKPIVPLQ